MKFKTKSFMVLSVFISLFLMVGCSGKPTKESNSAANDEQKPTKITLMLHVADKSSEATFSKVWEEFEKSHPDVEMEFIGNNGPNEQSKKVKLAAQNNNLPDIFWIQKTTAEELAKAGYLYDLSSYIQNSEAGKNILPGLIGGMKLGDMVYGLPYQAQAKGFWVNKDIFTDNGLKVPTQGTTYEELLTAAETLHSKGIATILNGSKSPYSCWSFLTGWARYGFYDHMNGISKGEDSFVNDDFINYFTKLHVLSQKGAFSDAITNTDYEQAVEYFSAGKGALLDSGSWAAGSESIKKMGDSIGFWWGPVFEDSNSKQQVAMMIPSSPLVVSKASAKDPKKLAAIEEFFDFYYGKQAAEIAIQTGSLPMIAYDGPISSDNAAYNAMMEAVNDKDWESPSAAPDAIVSAPVQTALYDGLYGVMSGVYAPEEALQKIQSVQEQQ